VSFSFRSPYAYWLSGVCPEPVNYYSFRYPLGSLAILDPPVQWQFGPQAVKRFMGVDPDFALGPLRPAANVRLISNDAGDLNGDAVRRSNVEARDRAARFIEFGDALFRQQQFHAALQRYKTAATNAPDMAEAYFRQSLALIALGNYDTALAAVRRGLQLKPDWAEDDFRLDSLYGDNRLAKAAHRESLARAVLADDSQNPDLLFLLGVLLHFDGQAARAQRFFRRAWELAPAASDLIGSFLRDTSEPAARAAGAIDL
jgi:tetratricopeptide (TPR) repeat protein